MGRCKVLKRERLPMRDGLAMGEVLIELQLGAQHFVYVDRLVQEERGTRAFRLRGWVVRRRFPHTEAELRLVLDSFRVLPR
jgi:hypothetical protein